MSGTYTLAEIHERHERLEELSADLFNVKSDPEQVTITQAFHEVGREFSGSFMGQLHQGLQAALPLILADLEAEYATARAQLKHDATAAYVAFMGGE